MESLKLIELKQIYNFIAENPIITNSNNVDRIKKFVEEYYYGKPFEIKICEIKHLLTINFFNDTPPYTFDINILPNFLHREDFIRWCTIFLLKNDY